MPRSKRRAGTVKGKTAKQIVHAAQNRAKRDKARRIREQAERRAAEQATRFAHLDDKYSNYPGSR